MVALSTDKAVNPVNLYGATKLCEEKLIVQGNAYAAQSDTKLSCVRYGNVVGSRGSVVPLFRDRSKTGQADHHRRAHDPVLDHPAQAVDLVLFALENTTGGEVFIPKIPSMKVVDLADAMAPGIPPKSWHPTGREAARVAAHRGRSRHSVDAGDVYVVLPEHPWWARRRMARRQPLPDGFRYESDTNDGGSGRTSCVLFLR